MTSLPSQFQQAGARTYQARKLASRAAQTASTVLYEVPANRSARIETVVFCSVHTGSATVRLHHLRPQESVGINNPLYYDLSMSAKTTTVLSATVYMSAGDRLVISAGTADHVCVTVYGEET